ncbi:meiosis induction protein kinase IME2/SME1 [Ceratobasidium sp. AG-Ba]|nr:meiosis induction protein kinase IME2/SME1 [Ceratobasidium sp. AG-Ba]
MKLSLSSCFARLPPPPPAQPVVAACDAAVMLSVAHEQHHVHPKHPDNAHPVHIVQNDMALPPAHPRPQPPRQPQTFTYTAVPGIKLSNDGTRLLVGDATTSSQRSWTTLKNVGDGSFGTVWLCDWHSPLPPGTPYSPMQCSPRVRPEWAGRRLVALKRMKRQWEGGWDECKTLKEIESLRAIPTHPNIIPLYDCFVLPSSLELYLVFESMEGNLYQLIKSRKGRKPLAGGLVTSIFQQVASALDHVHSNGYFHRDMKPENLLVTTTGLANYVSTSPVAPPGTKEEDVFVIIKLADFGLARETDSKPPYTEYVSTRWYRAPEVLLRSRDYSSPVDMWAFGTIIAELLNLGPLFPGQGEMDQLKLVNNVLGDPSDAYGFDENGRRRGGGPWKRGHELARSLGYQFPRNYPTPLSRHFTEAVPRSLIECIEDLLRYDPAERLTAKQCLSHRFVAETAPRQPVPPPLIQRTAGNAQRLPSPRSDCMTGDRPPYTGIPAVSPRGLPPNHAMSPAHIRPPFPNPNSFQSSMPPPQIPPSTTHRQQYYTPQSAGSSYNGAAELVDQLRESELPTVPGSLEGYSGEDTTDWHRGGAYTLEQQNQGPSQNHPHRSPYAMDISEPTAPAPQDYPMDAPAPKPTNGHQSSGKGKLFGLKSKLNLFGHTEKLPAVAEVNIASGSQTSLKRTQSNSTTDGKSIKDVAMPLPAPVLDRHEQKKQRKLELMEKRKMEEEKYRARAKGMVAKREMVLNNDNGAVDAWDSGRSGVYRAGAPSQPRDKGKLPMNPRGGTIPQSNTMQHSLLSPPSMEPPPVGGWRDVNAWRDSTDDDRSVASSTDLRRLSMATVNTVDSDPGPVRSGRARGASIGINRATSVSSLRAAAGFPRSARSSASLEAFAQDFRQHATIADVAMSDAGSPHPHRMGSLSPGPGGHGQSHWPVQSGDVPQLVLNGPGGSLAARRVHPHQPMSFTSMLSSTSEDGYNASTDAYRGSMSPGSPYESMSISPTAPRIIRLRECTTW